VPSDHARCESCDILYRGPGRTVERARIRSVGRHQRAGEWKTKRIRRVPEAAVASAQYETSRREHLLTHILESIPEIFWELLAPPAVGEIAL